MKIFLSLSYCITPQPTQLHRHSVPTYCCRGLFTTDGKVIGGFICSQRQKEMAQQTINQMEAQNNQSKQLVQLLINPRTCWFVNLSIWFPSWCLVYIVNMLIMSHKFINLVNLQIINYRLIHYNYKIIMPYI